MPIASSASALAALLLGVTAAPPLAREPSAGEAATSVSYRVEGSRTLLSIRTGTGPRRALRVRRDATVSPTAEPTSVRVIGELEGAAVILVDTYPSIPGGMSYCQAGEESFLRVISVRRSPPVETFRAKVGSCREDIELASPGIEWAAGSATLRIHWLSGPTGKPETRTVRIGSDGKPVHSGER